MTRSESNATAMKNNNASPTIYILAGPNGAGKTTFANSFLPTIAQCREFLNADLIAAGLSPFHPESQAIRASKLLLQRIDELVAMQESFSFETTLATRSYPGSIKQWRALGYRVIVYFLWLPSAEMAISRVAKRVREGGHHIPEDVVRRRYRRGLENLFNLYIPVASAVCVYDGSSFPPVPMAEIDGEKENVLDYNRWASVRLQAKDMRHD